MSESYKVRILKVILQSLDKSNLQKDQINYVLQVGGGCRMPMIKDLLKEVFPTADHRCMLNPDWVVANGAALFAYYLNISKFELNDKRLATPSEFGNCGNKSNAVGIDFGSSKVCASFIKRNGPSAAISDPKILSLPSYVAFDGIIPKCGKIVVDRIQHNFEYSVFDIHRIFGKSYDEIIQDPDWPFKIVKHNDKVYIEVKTINGKERKSPEEIISILLHQIKTIFDDFQNELLTDAIISIPSYFSEKQRFALHEAATLAGWENIYFLPEFIAASFAYLNEFDISNNSNILIFNLGNTVSACIGRIENGKFKFLSDEYNLHLGVHDFDKELIGLFVDTVMPKCDLTKLDKKYLEQKFQEIKHTQRDDAW
uniref:Uncharacterized protein n=1 Tax=Panagrolaimus davidi TaxID=227884 RepID=A0A914QQ07_9BILA